MLCGVSSLLAFLNKTRQTQPATPESGYPSSGMRASRCVVGEFLGGDMPVRAQANGSSQRRAYRTPTEQVPGQLPEHVPEQVVQQVMEHPLREQEVPEQVPEPLVTIKSIESFAPPIAWTLIAARRPLSASCTRPGPPCVPHAS